MRRARATHPNLAAVVADVACFHLPEAAFDLILNFYFLQRELFPEYARLLNEQEVPGVYFRPTHFKPTFNKFAGRNTGGVYLHVTDPKAFLPFLAGVAVVWAARKLYGGPCAFPHAVYEFNSTHPAFDLLAGNEEIRVMIESGKGLAAIASSWAPDEKEFGTGKASYHQYD